MGTNFNEKPKNHVSISRGGDEVKKIDPDSGETINRSFAQPNPDTPPPEVEPKAHASVKEEKEALTENSQEGRNYSNDSR